MKLTKDKMREVAKRLNDDDIKAYVSGLGLEWSDLGDERTRLLSGALMRLVDMAELGATGDVFADKVLRAASRITRPHAYRLKTTVNELAARREPPHLSRGAEVI
jgi:hypothetical protein